MEELVGKLKQVGSIQGLYDAEGPNAARQYMPMLSSSKVEREFTRTAGATGKDKPCLVREDDLPFKSLCAPTGGMPILPADPEDLVGRDEEFARQVKDHLQLQSTPQFLTKLHNVKLQGEHWDRAQREFEGKTVDLVHTRTVAMLTRELGLEDELEKVKERGQGGMRFIPYVDMAKSKQRLQQLIPYSRLYEANLVQHLLSEEGRNEAEGANGYNAPLMNNTNITSNPEARQALDRHRRLLVRLDYRSSKVWAIERKYAPVSLAYKNIREQQKSGTVFLEHVLLKPQTTNCRTASWPRVGIAVDVLDGNTVTPWDSREKLELRGEDDNET